MQLDHQSQVGFIRPAMDPDSRPWWSEIAQGQFTLPQCGTCHRRWFPPLPVCPHCGSLEVGLAPAEPGGAVYSWVVINRALNPSFSHDAPYTIVTVDLDAGARMAGRLLADVNTMTPGLRVEAEIYTVDVHHLVGFRPRLRGAVP